MKARESETRRGLVWRKQQESLVQAAFAHWEFGAKGALETGSGDQPATSCQLPIALEFKRQVFVKKKLWGKEGKEWCGLLPRGRASALGSLAGGFYLFLAI